MPKESTTPDLVELTRRAYELSSDGDFDALLALFDSDAVWDMSRVGLGVYQGREAIRRFFEDWRAPYEELRTAAEEVLEVGSRVTLAFATAKGRLAGSSGDVDVWYAAVAAWADGLVVQVTNYIDIDEARTAAEQLAESRA
jgi:ketosteroid isomerase-like protein